MPETFVQQDRLLQLKTPLGGDVIIPTAFSGSEAISSLFHFHVDVVAENRTQVEFDKLLGQKASLKLKTVKGERYFNGVVNAVSQGGRDERYTEFRLELVPFTDVNGMNFVRHADLLQHDRNFFAVRRGPSVKLNHTHVLSVATCALKIRPAKTK